MTLHTQRISEVARNTGSYYPTITAGTNGNGGGPKPLTRLEVEERCDGCQWPDTCASDRTCWRAERELEHQAAQQRARARLEETFAHFADQPVADESDYLTDPGETDAEVSTHGDDTNPSSETAHASGVNENVNISPPEISEPELSASPSGPPPDRCEACGEPGEYRVAGRQVCEQHAIELDRSLRQGRGVPWEQDD